MKPVWPGKPGGYVPMLADVIIAERQRRAKMVLPWMQPKNPNLLFTGGGGKDTSVAKPKKKGK